METFNVLKNSIEHLDKLNAINGGVAMLQEQLSETDEGYQAVLRLPSLSSEAFKLILDQERLLIYAELNGEEKPIKTLLRVFPVPHFIDVENIRAIYEGEQLIIRAPFKAGQSGGRREIPIER